MTTGIFYKNHVIVNSTVTFILPKGDENVVPGKKMIPIAIIVMLVVALGFTSTAAFAYWQDVNRVGNVVIRFDGEDANLIVEEVSQPFSGRLVPDGYIYFEEDVEEVTFEYEVSIDKTLVQTMNLVVEALEVRIGDSTEYAYLVDIEVGPQKDEFEYEIFNSVVIVTITVRLIEPIDAAEAIERGLDPSLANVDDSRAAYESIKGEIITFNVLFSVTPREPQDPVS